MSGIRYALASSKQETSDGTVGRLDKGQPGWSGGLVKEYADVVETLRVFDHGGFFISEEHKWKFSHKLLYPWRLSGIP